MVEEMDTWDRNVRFNFFLLYLDHQRIRLIRGTKNVNRVAAKYGLGNWVIDRKTGEKRWEVSENEPSTLPEQD